MTGLAFHDVRKSFGAVKALTGVTFAVREGEAHALVGENGAGKSTLLKILAGILRPDAGELTWHGERLSLGSPREALERGIGMVYQEMLCFPNLSVTGNIFAGRELVGAAGQMRDAEMRTRTAAILDELHLRISPDAAADSLPAAHRQLLQVARALAFDCRILVLDEPTTALTDAEADHLFAVLEKLKARGTTLLYVSHRLPEVFRLCDRITVLRDGAHAGTFDRDAVTPDHIVRAMVGRDLPPRAEHAASTRGSAGARGPRALPRAPAFRDVSLSVSPGRDRRPVRPGRVRTLGTARNDLRTAPGAGRIDSRRRDGARCAIAAAGGARRHRARPRGAPAAGTVLQPDAAAQPDAAGAHGRGRRDDPRRPRAGRDRAAAARLAHQGARPGRLPRQPQRRQPAEGGAREVAGDRHRAC